MWLAATINSNILQVPVRVICNAIHHCIKRLAWGPVSMVSTGVGIIQSNHPQFYFLLKYKEITGYL